MAGSINPFIPTIITDWFSGMSGSIQANPDCACLELKLANCLDAYGWHRGMEKCAAFEEDLRECIYKRKRLSRVEIMREERIRQYKDGKRSEKFEPTPPLDLF